MSSNKHPLFVDLDYTLVATDLLAESTIDAAKNTPLALLDAAAALPRGRQQFKAKLAENSQVDVTHLPYRKEVLNLIHCEKAKGRPVILATATNHHIASKIASHLNLFDAVLASDETNNLKGKRKYLAIREYCQEHGYSHFEYVGDSKSDLAIWQESSRAYLVGAPRKAEKTLSKRNVPTTTISVKHSPLRSLLRCLRPHQWLKNGLIFLPLLVGHELLNTTKFFLCLQAACIFSLVASSIYVINDLFDVSSDRQHPRKRTRPFASGAIPITWGPLLAGGLIASGFSLASLCLPPKFVGILAIYFVLNLLYTLSFKSKVIIDVVLLAAMYNLRVLAGGAASEIEISDWLLAFGMSIFTSLAFAKRYSELWRLENDDDQQEQGAKGRGYHTGDLTIVGALGPASGLISVLILSLYVNSDQVQTLYQNQRYLLLICPLLLYWISRLWLITGRGELREDPVAFAVTDWRSWTVAILGIATMLLAR